MHRRRPQEGYTLVELLVVIAIIGLIVYIAAPVANKTIEGAQFRADAHLVMSGLQKCRSQAVVRQDSITLRTKADLFDLMRPDDHSLSDDTQLQFAAPYACFPDGTTSGGRVVLSHGDRTKAIVASWLTGTVTMER